MIGAGRVVLLRRIGQAQGVRRESIPPVRWLLAPGRTFLLWRRMALWQITSYRAAIDTELALRRAVTVLRARHGRRWHRHAPADLVWMLRAGVAVDEACERVHALVGTDYESITGTTSPSDVGVLGEKPVRGPTTPDELDRAPKRPKPRASTMTGSSTRRS